MGQKIGKAEISHLQPLALVNPGDAAATDIRFAASHIKQRIMEKFGINLEEEVVFVGNFD
jgi:UDP-N-acetylmuramate dehydrogenase